MRPFRINAAGCALMDYIYPDISFSSDKFRKFLSIREGDGGLSPGKLVFAEEIEKFTGKDIHSIINELTGSASPLSSNIGGPSIVSVINAAQLLGQEAEINFFGAVGNDSTGVELLNFLEKTPVPPKNIIKVKGLTAFTDVLVDPDFESGHGERCFINNIGAAGNFGPDSIPESFFDAEIVVFGGTALVPQLHDHLDELLEKAKKANCFTIVNTVYDFRNEKNKPGKPWPLADFRNIDLLLMDFEEALKISGAKNSADACGFFISAGSKGFMITNGTHEIILYSGNDELGKEKFHSYPVSNKVKENIKRGIYHGDTTGCGDNFSGGVIYSIASQLMKSPYSLPDLREAMIWGIASGGFTCSYKGGCYFEKQVGEKMKAIEEIVLEYRLQTGF
jgi:sugar/nucleoside kinase (ribokinase family)